MRSLATAAYSNVQIILLDNASCTDSLSKIVDFISTSNDKANTQRMFPRMAIYNDKQISSIRETLSEEPFQGEHTFSYSALIIKNSINYGFAKAHNIILSIINKLLNYDYVWILNNDTIVLPDTLPALIREAELSMSVGLIGSVLRYHANPDTIQAIGGGKFYPWCGVSKLYGKNYKLDALKNISCNDIAKSLDYIMGASILIKKEVIRSVGLLSEDYFVYTEDLDYCFRARRAGWQLAVATDSHLLHKESSSTKAKKELYYYLLARNNTLFVKKYFSKIYLMSTALIFPLILLKWTRKPKNIFCGLKGLATSLFVTTKMAANAKTLK